MKDTHPLYSVIEIYNSAWNRHDVNAILALHTEDSVFCNHTSGGETVGHDAIRQIITGVFEIFPDIHFDLRRLYVRDDLVVQEWTATATHCNPITYNNKTLHPTGKRIQWNGMDILPMRNGQVVRKDVYAESLSFFKQLGASI
jgi:steroid delta-isomerase-like uncharacterized protein